MLTASQARDETLPKLSALVRLAQTSMGSKMAAYDAVGRRIGASGSWVRKFIGRQDTGLDGHVLHNIRTAYERLCTSIEAAADAAEASNALLREDLHAALRGDRAAHPRTPGGAPAAGATPRRPGRAAAPALVVPDARPRVPGLPGAGDLTDLPLWRAANEEEGTMVDGSDLARAHAGSARAAERLAANGALLGNSEAVARICHEVNRAICIAFGHDVQPSWDSAPDWQRDSAIKGVQFAIGNPDAPASAQHDAWTADKVAAGWTYGPTKDAEAKTHPCLVPYDDLPADQRVKDHTFQAVVAAARRLSDSFDRKPDATGKPAITRAEADAGLSDAPAPRVTVEDMEAKVASAEYFRSKTLTICILTLANGFTIVGKSACASPENYDQAKGERYAYDDAFRQIGAFEGYLLRERLAAEQAA